MEKAPPPWTSSAGEWWASKDRRTLDKRLATAREAEQRRAQPAEHTVFAQQTPAADCGVSLRDELDDCFGCGDLARVEAALTRAQTCQGHVEREGMGMVVRMLATYANSLREASSSNENVGCSDRPARCPVSRSCAADMLNKDTVHEAAQRLVARVPKERRPSLNAFVVGRTGPFTSVQTGS